MGAIGKMLRGGVALALGALLAVSAAPAVARAETCGVFEVTGGASGKDYTYTAPSEYEPIGGDVLTIRSSTHLTISTKSGSATAGGCRIVIESGVTANITLAGVNLTPTDANNNDGFSGIDLGSGATLNITLKKGNSNVIKGGTSTTGSPGPGIHIPEGSTLKIKGEGSLTVEGASGDYAAAVGIGGMGSSSGAGEACGNVIFLEGAITVHGGTSTTGSAPVDIGGGASDNGNGGDCGTVIILTSVNSGGSLVIGGGAGAAVGGGKGSDGAGIRPTGDGTYTVYGDLTLPCDITIPESATVTIPEGAGLTVPEGVELTNNGTILLQGGAFTNKGTVSGNQPTYPSKVTVSFSQGGKPVTSVPYGSTVTITATMEKAGTAANALSDDTGKVDFYLGDANDTGLKMGTGTVEFEGGACTASVNVTINQDKGLNSAGTFKFTADFGGYAPEGDESGDGLAPSTGSAQLTVVESYSIDYEDESITIAEGFSLYEEKTGGNAIFTSSDGNSTTSLTSYIQSAARNLYLQAPATGGAEQPDRRKITIPARPQAPSNTPTINYSEEKLNFPPNVTETTLEYALSQSDPNWQDVPSGAALSEMGWDGKTDKSYYFRTGATDTSFASEATQSPLIIPARPAAPNDLNLMDYTDVSVTYYVGAGVQCRQGNEGAWVTLGQNETDHTFSGLVPQTTYTVYARKPATESQFASAEASDEVTTKSSPAEPPAMTCEVTAGSVTLSYDAPWQYQTAEDDWVSVEGKKEFIGLKAATEYTFTVRVAESETAEASKVGTVRVWTAHPAPTGVRGGTNQITGVTANMEYSADGGRTWAACADGSVTGLTAGEYLVRRMGSGEIPASAAVSVTVTSYVPPAAPSGPDWGDVADEIAGAETGGRVVVDMDGETELPGEVLEALAGRDVTLVLQMEDGVAWEIYGADVPEGESFSDLDMGVDLGTDGIPVSVTNLVTGEAGVVQVTLAHEGPFGFAMTLVAPLGEKSEGLHANLYRYDESAGLLRFETSSVVGEGGTARLRLDHASQWAVALDSRSHELPFPDAAEGEWYSEPLRWAWLSGVVTGYGDGTAGPGRAVTRAEAAAVLWNAAGQPGDDGSALPADVPAGEWYSAPVSWALASGAFSGNGDGSFSPAGVLTREQAACVLYNQARATGEDVSARADLSGFADAASVSAWAADALSWAVAEGVLSGTGEGLLEPGRAITRSELCATLMNLELRGR